jgi:hypothetical protein
MMNATLKAPPIATRSAIEVARTEPTRIETTLFDLVVALQDAADPGDDAAVSAAVARLMQTGRIRFHMPSGRRN